MDQIVPSRGRTLKVDVPPPELRGGSPYSTRHSTESDGVWTLVDAKSRVAPSEPMVYLVVVADAYRLRTVAHLSATGTLD